MSPRSSHLSCLLLLAVLAPTVAYAQPAEPSLNLEQVTAREAFEVLGQRQGARFELADGEEWIGPEAGVRVTADLREKTFWESVLILGEQTGYEPVFTPYGRTGDGLPIIRVRRVDVRAEEQVRPAVAAGPLLVRSRDAVVTVPLKMSQIRMTPMQAAVRVEVFLEPGVPAAYVTAAALRAADEEGVDLRRGEGFDPTVAMDEGVAEMLLHFDVIRRVPLAVGRWQALMRIVESKRTEGMRVPVTVVPEEAEASGDGASRPSTQPSERSPGPGEPPPSAVAELGPYRMVVSPVRVGERAAGEAREAEPDAEAGAEVEAEPARRVATLRLVVGRESLDSTDWSRLYGFLVSMPPSLLAEGPDAAGGAWELVGYAIFSTPAKDEPQTAGAYRVWARYEAAPGTPDPAWLSWELPVESAEVRAAVVWEATIPIEAPAGPATGPATRKMTTRPAAGGAE